MSRRETALKYFDNMSEESRIRMSAGIEQYRKGDAKITVVGQDGKPIDGEVTVRAVLKNHEFRFGCNIFMLDEFETEEKNRIYREKFPELFNLATVPFYWSDLEPVEGKPRFSADSPKVYRRPATDRCVDYCLENGIDPKCHGLNYDNFAPDWVKNEPVSVHKRKLEKRMREIAARYADKIPSFEVIMKLRQDVNGVLEKARKDGRIGKALEAHVTLSTADEALMAACHGLNLAEVCIVSAVDWAKPEEGAEVGTGVNLPQLTIGVSEAKGEKCPRCWMHSLNANAEGLCPRCAGVISKMDIEL